MAAVRGLGEFLRARRARVGPAHVGLPAGTGLRRTPGLRREELAALAGVSIYYYIRLEQGRETNPSSAVLDSLAVRCCSMRKNTLTCTRSPASRGTRAKAQAGPPSPSPSASQMRSGPGSASSWKPSGPALPYVLNQVSDVLAANPEALALFHGLADWPPARRNTARYTFLHPAAQELFADWPHSAATTAANLHAVAATNPEAPGLAELVDELTQHSPEFARLWQRYDIRRRRGEPKMFRHPLVGTITLTYEVLQLGDSQRISVYQAAPGSTDEDALKLVATLAAELPAGPAGPP